MGTYSNAFFTANNIIKAKANTIYPEISCKVPWVYCVPQISPTADKNTIRQVLVMVAIGTAEIKRSTFLNNLDFKRYAKMLPRAVKEINDLSPPQESSTSTELWAILMILDCCI